MNSKHPKTTLILGAGASCPYGFPTASELREIIVYKKPDRVAEILHRLGAQQGLWESAMGPLLQHFAQDVIQRFQNEFFWSQTGSIDEFAQERGKPFADVATTALAAIFLGCESSSYLDGDWYRVFRRFLLKGGPDNIPSERVQVITFNYERSLEYYLWKAIQYTYGLPEGVAYAASSALPVYHAYGSLGSLRSGDEVPWGTRDYAHIERAANSLHLVRPTTTGLPSGVVDFLSESEFVCFLGFGFWPENFRMIERHVKTGAVYASNMGLAPALQNEVTNRFPKIKWGEGWTAEDCVLAWNLFS